MVWGTLYNHCSAPEVGDMMGPRSMLPLFLAIGLAGCSPHPDAIPGCQVNEELFGSTDIQSGTFRGDLTIVVWTDLAYSEASGSISSATGASASATLADDHAKLN